MSISRKLALLALLTVLISLPALADGVAGRKVNRGPAPLTAHSSHIMGPSQEGCVRIDAGHWVCSAPDADPAPTHRTLHKGAQSTAYRHHPQGNRAQVHIVRNAHIAAQTDSGITLTHIDSFTGGVGYDLDGGYHGGGGFILTSARRGTSLMGQAASRSRVYKRIGTHYACGGCGRGH